MCQIISILFTLTSDALYFILISVKSQPTCFNWTYTVIIFLPLTSNTFFSQQLFQFPVSTITFNPSTIQACDSLCFLFKYEKKHCYHQSLYRLPIWNSQNCRMFPLTFFAWSLQGHWWGFMSRNYVVWPILFSLLLKELIFGFYLPSLQLVLCGRKTSPRTSTIVQFIFYFFGPLRSAWIFWEIRNKWLV